MKQLKIKQLKQQAPQAAQLLEKYFNDQGVEFIDDRASIHERSDGLLRARLKGPVWHRVDYDKSKRKWVAHEAA